MVSGAAASGRRFVYNYEAGTAPKGLLEVRQWFTFKDYDSRERCECRTEFEEGVTDRFQLGLYVADWRYTDNDSGKDEAEWRTAGLEGIDSMTGPNKDVLDSALYGEVRRGPEKFALEGKLLLQKEGGPAITFRGGGAGFAEGQSSPN